MRRLPAPLHRQGGQNLKPTSIRSLGPWSIDSYMRSLDEARVFIQRHLEDDPYAERVLSELDVWIDGAAQHTTDTERTEL